MGQRLWSNGGIRAAQLVRLEDFVALEISSYTYVLNIDILLITNLPIKLRKICLNQANFLKAHIERPCLWSDWSTSGLTWNGKNPPDTLNMPIIRYKKGKRLVYVVKDYFFESQVQERFERLISIKRSLKGNNEPHYYHKSNGRQKGEILTKAIPNERTVNHNRNKIDM